MSRLFTDQTRMLAGYLRTQKLPVLLLATLLAGSIALQLLNPQILKNFIDSATHAADDRTLALAAGLFLAIALVQQFCSVGATYLSENIGWSATNALRADLLSHCLRLDLSFHKARTPGELIERLDGDVTVLANLFSQLVIQVAGNLLLLLGILVILWNTDWRIGLLMTCFTLLGLFAMRRVQAVASPLWKIARQRSAELFGFIEERLSGTEDIRSSGAQSYTMRRLYEHLAAQMRAERKARVVGQAVWTTSDLLLALGTAATYLLAARLFRAHALTIGTVYSLFFYIALLFRPLTQITRQAEDFQKAGAGIARVRELFQTRSALEEKGNACLPAGPLSITFHHARFQYEEAGETVLNDLSFHIGAGRVVGVLGRTGSGKTTLTRLLFRLYDPQEGTIALGDRDIRDVPLRDLRQRVGIVTQEVQLFHATVRDNLTLFDETISDARIRDAIRELGLQSWLEGLPNGLETMLAAGSGGLSAGEAQLLAFTRIFLRDPGLVILDEASSRLDPATEQRIERAIDKLLVNRTGLIIAHRLHTVQRADDILILHEGALAEYGERERLRRDPNSRFARLLQTGLQEALA